MELFSEDSQSNAHPFCPKEAYVAPQLTVLETAQVQGGMAESNNRTTAS